MESFSKAYLDSQFKTVHSLYILLKQVFFFRGLVHPPSQKFWAGIIACRGILQNFSQQGYSKVSFGFSSLRWMEKYWCFFSFHYVKYLTSLFFLFFFFHGNKFTHLWRTWLKILCHYRKWYFSVDREKGKHINVKVWLKLPLLKKLNSNGHF